MAIANPVVTPGATITDGMVDLGTMEIPQRGDLPIDEANVDPSFVFTITLTPILSDANAKTIDVDAIYLVPIDEDVLDIELSANSTAADQAVSNALLPSPLTYLLASDGFTLRGQQITTRVDSRLSLPPNTPSLFCPLLFEGASTSFGPGTHNLADTLTLNLQWWPQYAVAVPA